MVIYSERLRATAPGSRSMEPKHGWDITGKERTIPRTSYLIAVTTKHVEEEAGEYVRGL